MARLRDRSTADLLVVIIAGTICAAILVVVVGLVTIELVHPSDSLASASANLNDILNTLIGLMAGYLAGRTEVGRLRRRRDDEEEP